MSMSSKWIRGLCSVCVYIQKKLAYESEEQIALFWLTNHKQ